MPELEKLFDLIRRDYQENQKQDYLNEKGLQKSFYITRQDEEYIHKIDYDTPVQLQGYLDKFLKDEELKKYHKIIVVAAFKLRESEKKYTDIIKEKVYNF